MKRFSLLALSAFMTLQPVLASAYFTSPQDLFTAIRTDGASKTFSGEMHANLKDEQTGDVYLSMWMSGKQKGTLVANAGLDMKMTVDVVVPSSHVKVRAKVAVRVVKENLYVQLQSLDGTYDDVLSTVTLKGLMKKWIQIPLPAADIASFERAFTDGSMNMNDFFQMARTQTRTGNTYEIHFSRDFLKQLSGRLVVGLHAVPDFLLKVDTNSVDEFLNSKLTLNVSDTFGSVSFTAQSQRTASASIAAPTNVIHINQLQQQMGFMDSFGINPFNFLMSDPCLPSDGYYPDCSPVDESWNDSDFNYGNEDGEWDWNAGQSSSSVTRVSRRTLANQYREQEARRNQLQGRTSSASSASTSYAPVGDYTPALPAGGLSMGKTNAPITIVEFGDYECPYCARFHAETLPSIVKNYVDTGKVRFVFRNFPLSFHPYANDAALAVECARNQSDDLAWKLNNALFDLQADGPFTDASIPFAMSNLVQGLNINQAFACVNNAEKQSVIDQDYADGEAGGINGAPSFWVLGQNGYAQLIQGAYPYETFQKVIDGMLP